MGLRPPRPLLKCAPSFQNSMNDSGFLPLPDSAFPPLEEQEYQTPPHSLESEAAVLGSLMLDNTAWDAVTETIRESHFYRDEHQLI